MKKKLCVFTLYSEKGASSRYRAYIFEKALRANYDVRWFSFWNDKYVTKYMHNKKKYFAGIIAQYLVASIRRMFQLLVIAPNCDVVFIQKATVPKIKCTFLNRVKQKNKRIVFDVDDAIYTLPKDNSKYIAQIADTVICGNDTLKKYYDSYCKNCVVIPTVDNTNMYEPYWGDTFKSKIIGWIGSKTTIDNFDIIIAALNEVTAKHPEVKIAIISNTALDYTERVNNSYLVPWTQDTYLEQIGKFSIGIMPLKDNDMNRGKCGFKLIQYLNMKKPVIGSGVGVNGEIIEGNGIVANTTEEWVNALELLLFNEKKYQECVKHIENEFFDTYRYENVLISLLELLGAN